jgi:hypothetical protein
MREQFEVEKGNDIRLNKNKFVYLRNFLKIVSEI